MKTKKLPFTDSCRRARFNQLITCSSLLLLLLSDGASCTFAAIASDLRCVICICGGRVHLMSRKFSPAVWFFVFLFFSPAFGKSEHIIVIHTPLWPLTRSVSYFGAALVLWIFYESIFFLSAAGFPQKIRNSRRQRDNFPHITSALNAIINFRFCVWWSA